MGHYISRSSGSHDSCGYPVHVHTEEPGDAQEMYAQLTNVLQAVITNKDADIQKLMDTANSNYQKTLDSEFKKN